MSNPGDVQVNSLTIKAAGGTLDLTTSFMSMSIYESIFTPGIVCYINVLDTDDQIGVIQLVGNEPVSLSIQVPGGEEQTYSFTVMSHHNNKGVTASMKSKMYTIKMISDESVHGHLNYTIKPGSTQISNLIKQVVTDLLHSQKNVIVEDTKGTQNIILNGGMSAHEAMAMIRKRAVSASNKSSFFVFYETRDAGKMAFKFSTIEQLFQGSSVKTFQQSDAINSDILAQTDNQILALETPSHFNALEILKGAASDVIKYDLTTQTYNKTRTESTLNSYKSGGQGNMLSADAKSKFIDKAKNLKQHHIVQDNYKDRAVTGIAESAQDKSAYVSILAQNSLKFRTYGDFKLIPGAVVTLNIPTRSSTTDNKDNDSQLSGKFLISRIHHEIGLASESPRYTCVVECIKGNLEKGA
jgi:hypothetical protein